MMNNPMQFIDLAHGRGDLMDLYSDKQSVLDSNVSGLFEDGNNTDPTNLQKLILKHLVKVYIVENKEDETIQKINTLLALM